MTAICDAIVGNQVFGTLIRRDTKTNKPVPNLAQSWKIVDPNTFEFKLRPNMTFQDGTKLDAAAAKAALDITRAPTSRLEPDARRISSIDAGADGLTVTLHLSTPIAGIMPLTLAGREGYDRRGGEHRHEPDRCRAVQVRLADRRAGDPPLEVPGLLGREEREARPASTTSTPTNAPDRRQLVIAGDLDMIEGAGLANLPAENDPNIKIEHGKGADYWKLNMNTAKPPFDNVDFRRAMNYAINKTAIAKAHLRRRLRDRHAVVPVELRRSVPEGPGRPVPVQRQEGQGRAEEVGCDAADHGASADPGQQPELLSLRRDRPGAAQGGRDQHGDHAVDEPADHVLRRTSRATSSPRCGRPVPTRRSRSAGTSRRTRSRTPGTT